MKLVAALALAGLAACTHRLELEEHPLNGRIWDARAAAVVTPAQVFERAARARHVILGETHDNPEHHRLQLAVLEALAARGAARVLALEQLDTEHQAAIDAALANGADAETLAGAAQFDRKGWDWPLYRPLVQFALAHQWPIAAGNLSRDARMAQVLAARGRTGSVLITGNGHARRDRGVPLYLEDRDVLSIAFLEVQPGKASPPDYLDGFASAQSYDYVWFTARAARKDPCS
jgi:uncharacterized iron-regulated protein